MTHGVDLLLCAWFVLCAVAFWGSYIGLTLTPGLSNALYAAFLLMVIAIVAVRWLRGRTEAENAARDTRNARDATNGISDRGRNKQGRAGARR